MHGNVISRHSRELVERAIGSFRVVIINGPRQAGKSTLLELLHEQVGGTRVTLDDLDVLRTARSDPGGLVEESTHPLLIDEVQRGGERLILAIKADVDRHGFDVGRYVLAGSSRFLTIPTLTESLAGRARIIDLWPLSQAEREGVKPTFIDALFGSSGGPQVAAPPESRRETLERMVVGGFPALQRIGDRRDREDWFADYIATILQRDLAQLRSPRRSVDLPRLLRLIAHRTAGELVVAPLASSLGLTADTIKDYLGLFESIYFHSTTPAWTPGGTGRVVHRPKLHIIDSGIACHLNGVGVDQLAVPGSAAVGPLLESFVAGEVQRQVPWSDTRPVVHHFRDNAQREIDLILETRDGRVAAIEVKAARDVDDDDFRHLRWLRDRLGERFISGVVVHLGERALPAGDRLASVPITALWSP